MDLNHEAVRSVQTIFIDIIDAQQIWRENLNRCVLQHCPLRPVVWGCKQVLVINKRWVKRETEASFRIGLDFCLSFDFLEEVVGGLFPLLLLCFLSTEIHPRPLTKAANGNLSHRRRRTTVLELHSACLPTNWFLVAIKTNFIFLSCSVAETVSNSFLPKMCTTVFCASVTWGKHNEKPQPKMNGGAQGVFVEKCSRAKK